MTILSRVNGISRKASIALNTMFITYSLICIIPFVLVIAVSFTDEKSLLINGYSFFPKKLSLHAYEYLYTTGAAIIRAYGITIFNTIVGTIGSVLVISLFAYPLSRKDFKYKKLFSIFVFITMIFNGGLVPWYFVYSNVLHLKNNLLIYILPHLMSVWYVMIMRTFFSTSVPDSLIESARIDGAGEFRTFFKIVLPISLPGLATVALFNSVTIWNDYWIPLVFITQSKLYNLQYSMYSALLSAQYLAENSDKIAGIDISSVPVETVRMAMCIVAIGPIALVYPFFQKYFVKGLTVGAVKG